jgi:hypothetical protein
MAKSKVKEIRNFHAKPKSKRPGVHAKSKASRSKNSKNYLKRNVGQG